MCIRDRSGALIRDLAWDFGDGALASGAFVEHTFAHPGRYRVTLTVTLAAGEVHQAVSVVSVQQNIAPGDGTGDPDDGDPNEPPDDPDLRDPQSFLLSADAGPDREASANTTVILDGSASLTGGNDDVGFRWSQIVGTPVALQDADQVRRCV